MKKAVTFKEAVFLIVSILLLIGISIIGYKLPAHVGILGAIFVLILFMIYKNMSWSDLNEGIISGITPGLIPIILFILIGSLISIWIASGTIPTIMVYGFSFLSPKFFLVAIFFICGIVGAAVGSSFTTISTIGVAFIGMGQMMGFDLAITTGAIVSGAFLGNVISPLSDTANLSAATANIDIFTHLKMELKTVLPAVVISFIYFTFASRSGSGGSNLSEMEILTTGLKENFMISPIMLLPVGLLFFCAWRKVPAIPTIFFNLIFSITLQNCFGKSASITEIGSWIQDGYVSNTGNELIDKLLSRGGIQSMMWSISLILLALTLGGLLIKTGVIDIILKKMEELLNTPSKLIGITSLVAIVVNVLIGEQYLSIILPGEAFKNSFTKQSISPAYLSRTLCDAGSTTNPLIPWGVSAVFISSALGVPTIQYLPYAIFCYTLPLVTIIFSFFIKPNEKQGGKNYEN
ncbi:Na+/H+ antiporter NhaC [Vagococcus carniphilus]|uniref:Na+/H+ antiporter NhaC n=1 Tax=Vagococcus carniphilus TaxID=218144 RepID=UPI00288E4C6C|nr:Na+/H+ antiporter NhaC [Vagococcus carniphilus]MDT2831558.1 Na+/H+ antiporter NhaC [Vagococcus carniphilus]MDT2840534.1 Na+/H+ antiporter NhaC [Vagococcus carniphilus]MDT2855192.1 Na+/H+ antiporter NhaC [Vagococcus carniphilus]